MTDISAAAPPIKPPPANDSCRVCFFSEEDALGIWRCCFNPPGWQRSNLPNVAPPDTGTLTNWPIVGPDDWCGHGYNTLNSAWMTPDGTKL
jgi:hypothetical protein